MKPDPVRQNEVLPNTGGMGTMTRKMILERARELAVINGRSPMEAAEAEFAQAKRELMGLSDVDAKTETLESIPESERWDPLPGSTGQKIPVSFPDETDIDGHSETERLVDQGIAAAEHDQMLQAAKAATKNEGGPDA